jgi:hypothetical protein
MTSGFVSPNSAAPVPHSQLVLPKREIEIPDPMIPDDYESLWARVNRICDQYITSQYMLSA